MDNDTLQSITDAVRCSRTDIVRSLVEICEKGSLETGDAGQKLSLNTLLNTVTCDAGTSLHFATKLGNTDIVRTLLSAGADPSIQNSDGETPYDLANTERMVIVYMDELLRCAANSDTDRINKLITAGVPVNGQDRVSCANTALHWAATFGNPAAVQCLLGHGAHVNISNADGATPLHDAVVRQDLDIIKLLLNAGADPYVKCVSGKYEGKSPIQLAKDEDIKNLIMSFANVHVPSAEMTNGTASVSSSSLESLRIENGVAEDIGRLSVTSADTPVKHNMASYVNQVSTLPPFPQLTSPPLLITDTKLHLLWPLPQQIIQIDEPCFKLRDKYSVSIVSDGDKSQIAEIMNVWKTHDEDFNSGNICCSIEEIVPGCMRASGNIICYVSKELLHRSESYKIVVNSEQLKIFSGDVSGLHYGLSTVNQLFNLYQGEDGIPSIYKFVHYDCEFIINHNTILSQKPIFLMGGYSVDIESKKHKSHIFKRRKGSFSAVKIEDWPVLRYRAVLLDMVPSARKATMETLKGIIKILSALKVNEIHFYFRYGLNNETKWPYCNCDLIEITNFCYQHCIVPVAAVDVLPETPLEELNNRFVHVQSLVSLFSSKKIHIGPNLSKILLEDVVKRDGAFQFHEMLRLPSHCLVYVCSNGYSTNAKLLYSMPLNVIFIEFGYQAEYDYDSSIKSIVTSGLPAFVGVGTSSWGSVAGCPESAVHNIYKAAQAASCKSALGLIIADWKTNAHHPAFCFSWPGILVASGLGWNNSIHLDFLHTRLPELLNHHVLHDTEQLLGYLTVELGRLEAFVHQAIQNPKVGSQFQLSSSVLHQLLVDPDSVPLDNFSAELMQQAVRHLKKFELDLQKAKPECFQKGEIVAELQLAVELMLFSCKLAKVMVSNGTKPFPGACGLAVVNIGVTNLPPIAKTDLANRLLALVEQFRGVWLSRNLPCGLHESLYLFNALLHKLIPDSEHYFSSADGFVRHQ